MKFEDLVPWRWNKRDLPARREEHPIDALHREMDSLFNSFLRRFESSPLSSRDWPGQDFSPLINVSETDKEIVVEAQVPGMDENDVQVNLTDDYLTIRGSKKEEKSEEKAETQYREFRYGSFERSVPLPKEVDADQAKASFSKGVLKIQLPKKAEARRDVRSIPIRTE